MGPRPVRLNRGPPIRYTDSSVRRGSRAQSGDKEEESDGSVSSTSPASSPPSSPFHGFVGYRVPVGPGVLDGGFRSSLATGLVNARFPPRRLGWITSQQRPTCPAFPQVCQGGHVHKGRTRFGARRQSVSAQPVNVQGSGQGQHDQVAAVASQQGEVEEEGLNAHQDQG